jgi:beta-lactamase regulating signal transducer with metallopeptidase domain
MSDVSLPQTMIVGHLWQSVALAAVLAGVLIAGKKMRGSTRYGLSTAAFLAALVLPLAAFIPGETIVSALLKELNAPVALASKHAPAPVAEVAAPVAPVAPLLRNVVFAGTPVAAPAVPAAPVAPVIAKAEAAPAPLFTLPEIKLPDMTLPLLAIWAAGALLLLLRTARDLIAVERLVARAKPAKLPDVLKARMKGVRVIVSPEAPGPMAAGLFRPSIVLPESIALGSPGMAALLEHEHAHIERRDMLAALGQRVVLALLWWSPALHWISRRIDEEREVACDESAVDRTGDAKAFARSLTKQAENQLWVRAPKLAVGAIGPRSQVGRRIKRLIDIAKSGGHPSKYAGRLGFAGLALAIAVAAMVTPRFTAYAQPPGDSGKSIDLTSPKAREQAKNEPQLDGKGPDKDWSGKDWDFRLDGKDFAGLGDEISRLMDSIGPEISFAMADLSPELQAELADLSTEMSALGVDISSAVSQEVLSQMPAIMEDVRRALEDAGIDPNAVDNWQNLSGVDHEELRRALQEAHDELKQKLGPELQAEIRAALEEARAEIAAHRDEIAAAMRDKKQGLAIAREALAAARAEIDAARARGDFRAHGADGIDFDFDRDVGNALRQAGISLGSIHFNPDDDSLFEAASDCDMDGVNKLIAEKKEEAKAMIPGRGSALMAAAEANCADAARALVTAGADVNAGFPGAGTPLSLAAANSAMPVAQLLINRGADVNANTPGFDTPLVAAAKEGDLAMVKLLVEHGANVNAVSRTGSGQSALQAAERHGNDEVATYLQSKGAKPQQ